MGRDWTGLDGSLEAHSESKEINKYEEINDDAFLSPLAVGHCASIRVRAGALGGQRGAATTTLVEFLPAAGHVWHDAQRVAIPRQESVPRAELYRAL